MRSALGPVDGLLLRCGRVLCRLVVEFDRVRVRAWSEWPAVRPEMDDCEPGGAPVGRVLCALLAFTAVCQGAVCVQALDPALASLSKGAWSAEEDAALRAGVAKHGEMGCG